MNEYKLCEFCTISPTIVHGFRYPWFHTKLKGRVVKVGYQFPAFIGSFKITWRSLGSWVTATSLTRLPALKIIQLYTASITDAAEKAFISLRCMLRFTRTLTARPSLRQHVNQWRKKTEVYLLWLSFVDRHSVYWNLWSGRYCCCLFMLINCCKMLSRVTYVCPVL